MVLIVVLRPLWASRCDVSLRSRRSASKQTINDFCCFPFICLGAGTAFVRVQVQLSAPRRSPALVRRLQLPVV
jgi:hypothetical protein